VEYGMGRHMIWADFINAGDDLVVFIGGGECPHIGSWSVCDPGKEPLSMGVPCHKDHIISSKASKKIADISSRRCLVIAGVHTDGASRDDIEKLLGNSDKCVDMLLEFVG
jgi:hypothetical protein